MQLWGKGVVNTRNVGRFTTEGSSSRKAGEQVIGGDTRPCQDRFSWGSEYKGDVLAGGASGLLGTGVAIRL